jgi:hypothetical protein
VALRGLSFAKSCFFEALATGGLPHCLAPRRSCRWSRQCVQKHSKLPAGGLSFKYHAEVAVVAVCVRGWRLKASSARKGCRRRPHFQGVDRPLGEFQGLPEDGVAVFATKAIWSPRPIKAKDRFPVKIGAVPTSGRLDERPRIKRSTVLRTRTPVITP